MDTHTQFDPGLTPTPFTAAMTHLAVSGVYGILFVGFWRPMGRAWPRLPVWLAGLGFGLALWLLALIVTSARSNLDGGWLQGIPVAQLAAAHGLYGLALGCLVSRFKTH